VAERHRDLPQLADHLGQAADHVQRHRRRGGRHGARHRLPAEHETVPGQGVRAGQLEDGLQHQPGERLQVRGRHVVARDLGGEAHDGAGLVVGHARLQPHHGVGDGGGWARCRRLGAVQAEFPVRRGGRRPDPVHDPGGDRVAGLDPLGQQHPDRVAAEHQGADLLLRQRLVGGADRGGEGVHRAVRPVRTGHREVDPVHRVRPGGTTQQLDRVDPGGGEHGCRVHQFDGGTRIVEGLPAGTCETGVRHAPTVTRRFTHRSRPA
jgi:hypothetical protein